MDRTDEQVEVLRWAFNAAGIDMDNLVEAIKIICEAMVICYMDLEKAMERVADIVRADEVETARALEEFEAAMKEKGELLDLPNARDRKEARARRNAFERANAARFYQYKARESAWAARKRTGPRRREWRGPWRSGKN